VKIPKSKYSLEYIDALGERHVVQFNKWEYNNLMELIWDRTIEDWGDCKGRAWCGSCHVNIIQTIQCLPSIDQEERHCLSNQENKTAKSRLACQLEITETLDGAVVKYLGAT